MKYLLITIQILFLSALTFGQTPVEIPKELQKGETDIRQDEWNLIDYQFKVEEIQKKIDFVKSNPDELAKAEESGWLAEAEDLLKKAKYERDTHIEKFNYQSLSGFPVYQDTNNDDLDEANYERQLHDWIHKNASITKEDMLKK